MTPEEQQRAELRRMVDQLWPPDGSDPLPLDKPWWESKTIWGVLLLAWAQVVQAFGYELSFDVARWAESLAAFGTFAGLALTWWGRLHADRPIDPKRVLPGLTLP